MLTLFTILSIVNVVTSTIKSIVTIKCGKWLASLVSAAYYGYYTVVMIYTVAEFPLWQKVVVTFGCNLVGVFIVKYIEEKSRKDKLWKIEVTVPKAEVQKLLIDCRMGKLSYNYVDIQKYYLFNFYCPTQAESAEVKKLLKGYNVKYFVSESKNL